MSFTLGALTFDAADPERLAAFWSAVVGRPYRAGTVMPEVRVVAGGDGFPMLLFLPVPEPKTAKNRCHPDLHASDLEGEVARVLALGATEVARHDEAGTWVVLQDLEGNEFCIVADE